MRYRAWSALFGLACWCALHGRPGLGRRLYLLSDKLWRERFSPDW